MADTAVATVNGTESLSVPSFESVDEILGWLRKQRTPLDMIETREGRGGQEFYYVRHQYVTKILNELCRWNWDFEILRERLDGDQITVLGKLTCRVGQYQLVKSQYGSAEVKRYSSGKKSGDPMSLGDDFKAAASDSLKKCASLMGIGLDLSIPVQPDTLTKLHIAGNNAYEKSEKHTWDEKRPYIIRVFTGDRQSSKNLLEVEARILTSVLEGGNAPIVKEARKKLRS